MKSAMTALILIMFLVSCNSSQPIEKKEIEQNKSGDMQIVKTKRGYILQIYFETLNWHDVCTNQKYFETSDEVLEYSKRFDKTTEIIPIKRKGDK